MKCGAYTPNHECIVVALDQWQFACAHNNVAFSSKLPTKAWNPQGTKCTVYINQSPLGEAKSLRVFGNSAVTDAVQIKTLRVPYGDAVSVKLVMTDINVNSPLCRTVDSTPTVIFERDVILATDAKRPWRECVHNRPFTLSLGDTSKQTCCLELKGHISIEHNT